MSLSKVAPHPSKVYFYRGVVDPTELSTNEQVQKAVKEILSGEMGSGNIEKLKVHDIYSYRITLKERLLFKPISLRGKCFLLILDYLPNHEYSKSKFLNPSIAKQFVEQVQENVGEKSFDATSFTFLDQELFDPLKVKREDAKDLQIIYQPADFYASNFIELDPIQESALTAKTPLIINGPPGSGKSCVAICGVIANYVASAPDDGYRKRVLYICSQSSLANIMRLQWEQSPLSKREHCTVEFWSYQDFLSTNLGDSFPKNGEISLQMINEWFDQESKRLADLSKVHASVFKIKKQHLNLLFEEFQIISILDDERQYLDLGKKECCFFEETDKKSVWDLFISYKKMLKVGEWYDERFFQIPKEAGCFPLIDLIFNDEAADLAPLPYKQLIEMARGHHIIFSLDTNQDTSGNFSKRVLMQAVFNKLHIPFHTLSFASTYRCAQRIVEVANKCLDIKACFKKGTSDREEDRSIQYAGHNLTPGFVMRVDAFSIGDIYQQILAKGYKATDVAIISTDKEMKKKLGIALIFTPDEIKGDEYKVIILDNPLQSDEFKQLNRSLDQPNQQQYLNRPKTQSSIVQKQLESDIAPEINGLYVSMTRALELLVFREDKTRENEKLLKHLGIDQPLTILDQIPKSFARGSSTKEWLHAARRLWINGNTEQFEAICQYHLQLTSQEVLEKLKPVSIKQDNPTSSLSNLAREKIGNATLSQNTPVPSFSLKKGTNEQKKIGSNLPIQNKNPLVKKRKTRISENKKEQKIAATPSAIRGTNRGVKELSLNEKNMLNAAQDGSIALMRKCFKKGANINAVDGEGYTALMHASHRGQLAIVELLLEKRANVNIVNGQGVQALLVAAQGGYKNVIELLLEKGANVNARDEAGCTALIQASYKGFNDVVELLLEKGANVHLANHQGSLPLRLAAQNGHIDVIERLLKNTADVNAVDNQGGTALMIASQEGHENIVELLLEKGADVNRASGESSTSLMLAAEGGYASVVELLLQKGADPNMVDSEGKTAVMLAASFKHSAVIKVIIAFAQKMNGSI